MKKQKSFKRKAGRVPETRTYFSGFGVAFTGKQTQGEACLLVAPTMAGLKSRWEQFSDHPLQEEAVQKIAIFLDEAVQEEGRDPGKPEPDPLSQILRIAKGEIEHLYNGWCPDRFAGLDRRDPLCPACQILMEVEK